MKNRGTYLKNLQHFKDEEIFSRQIESLRQGNIEELERISTYDLRLKSFVEFAESWREHLHSFGRNIIALTKFSFVDKMEPYFVIDLLYSALLDADNMNAAGLALPRRLEIPKYIVKNYIRNNLQGRDKDGTTTKEIDRLRTILFEHVDKQSFNLDNNKIITITAATGLGKTLTAMNCAINLREQINLQKGYKPRIIYVAPFISILDQNMEVLQSVFLDKSDKQDSNLLLMHHHLAPINYRNNSMDNEAYTTWQSEFLTHGWNAEVIVTTFIQFFNTIFGRYTSQLRRLNNLMGSIVILDEVQSIRNEYWKIVRSVLLFFSKKFNLKIILMTATPPPIFEEGETIEMAETNTTIENIPERVSFQLRNQEQITLDKFCIEMNALIVDNKNKNILIELNTISTAKDCFDKIHSNTHVFRFLSSQVIPRHRRQRIHEIKQTLDDNNSKPVIVVTTQVIEAGVDLDFDIAVRDIGPIDSIVQTAGRCNRNGMRKATESPFFIYRIVDDRRLDNRIIEHARYVYGDVAIEIANSMLKPGNLGILDLVEYYYKEVKRCGSERESNEISADISELNYEEVEKKFELIDEGDFKVPVFVEFDNDARMIWERFVNLRETERKKSSELIQLRHDMEHYMIDVRENEVQEAGLQIVNEIYKIDYQDIGVVYEEEKGFISHH